MYFSVLGKHSTISIYELNLVCPQNISRIYKNHIVTFETSNPHMLPILGGSIKSGRVVETRQLEKELSKYSLVGIENISIGKIIKKEFDNIKRFKQVPLTHTDRDIKNKGVEVIKLPHEQRGIVDNYQNIPLYEKIDFQKPSSGMQIGMMPAKLTHILINIAIYGTGQQNTKKNVTIRDPFCGFGTTNFVANAYHHHSIGSDINITEAKRNIKRRTDKQNTFFSDNKLTIFKHDVTQPFNKPFLGQVDCIVSEGRLGPIISHRTRTRELALNIQKITEVYQKFFHNLIQYYHEKIPSIVITVPQYQNYHGTQVSDQLQNFLNKIFPHHTYIDEIYVRKKQTVGRKILTITALTGR